MLWKLKQFSIPFSILSGVLLALPFNNGKLWIFAWFAFVPLFLALDNKTLKQPFFLFFIAGITFWSATVYWLVNVTLIGIILLILYLALYFAIFGLIIRPFTRRSQPYILLFVPAVWALLEYIRSHFLTGFPWALLGYSQYLNLPVIQIADITGVWGVSFLVMLVNVAVVEMIWSLKLKLWPRLKVTVLAAVLPLALILSYGFFHLSSVKLIPAVQYPVKISLVQGNIPQELKWDPVARDSIMQNYFELTSRAAKDNPDLIIWPEAALPVVLEEEPEYYMRVRQYLKAINKPLLFGSVTQKDGLYYNSALLLSGDVQLLDQYDKLHLVPFGEYIPFRDTIRFLDTIAPIGDITRGEEYTIFELPGFPVSFGVLICFEDVFPELARNFVTRGAGFLVNITNDAWFGKTPEAYQHLAASVFR
ncbi:MAG: apolipoprotein N-acyltransferase, partial [Candidatus Omnitrophota bacterium]